MSAHKFILRAAVLALVIQSSVQAEVVVGTPVRGDTRLIQYHYDPDATYLVLAKPKAVTHLQFAANEVIRSVAAGDTSSFELTPTKDRHHIFIKPKWDDMETSMTVLTDQRTYQFVLRSTGEGKKWHQRVSWIYASEMLLALPESDVAQGDAAPAAPAPARLPEPAQADPTAAAAAAPAGVPGIKPDSLRFSYEVSGDASFKPSVVFDDGRFTYYKLPQDIQELPALFAVIDGNDYSLVNFEVKGQYLVAQRLMPQAVLKLGRAEVRITKLEPKKSFFGFQTEQN